MIDWSKVIAEILATVIFYSIVSYLFIWAISGLFDLKCGINEFPYILVLFLAIRAVGKDIMEDKR